jgi:ornithine cyclodeaminase
MIAFSQGRTRQTLRSIIDLDDYSAFSSMLSGAFGAKLVSVFPKTVARGRMPHQGVVAIFYPQTGALEGLADGRELTAIRTAAASAAATDALARADACTLALLGTG